MLVPASLLAVTVPADAQTPDTTDAQVYHLYHASRGESWVLKPDGRPTSLPVTPLQTVAPTGDKVCVRVVNPHPGLYRYSIRATVDTSKVEYLPKEASQLVAVLGTVFPKRSGEGDAPGGARRGFRQEELPDDPQTADPIGRYAVALDDLASDIKWVQQAVQNSDRPGTIRNEGGIFRVEAGREQEFRWVRETINGLSDASGRFRSTKLEADLDSIHQRAVADARKDPKH
ncbi:MAG TPA: hypothetical protein VK399_06780, partial [Longimicrobiaceae bacterium]|nr:hypothetical protein [Longimicrobiaceae bacterium]